jgi:D-3-phosphoglycerate dehydrogenase
MYKIQTLNVIDPMGLAQFPTEHYQVAGDITHPDAILVRSASLHQFTFSESIKVIARAGAGVNSIPIEQLTELAIPVLNTPGANANAVKELVLAGMLLACRNLCQAWDYVCKMTGDDEHIHVQVEKDKKQFAGFELPGKTLGVIGLGNIGAKVANAARALGMRVMGYDPTITVKQAWELSSDVKNVPHLDQLIKESDFISLHVPLLPETKHLINAKRLALVKPKAVLLNFSRENIVDNDALKAALDNNQLFSYVCDFPCVQLKNHPRVISFPHLGASTKEAEETCAIMAANQVREFLENGNIINSVNFPHAEMPHNKGNRIAITNANITSMVAQISTKIADAGFNIVDLLNKSKEKIAYTLIDVDGDVSDSLLQEIAAIQGVIKVRYLSKLNAQSLHLKRAEPVI